MCIDVTMVSRTYLDTSPDKECVCVCVCLCVCVCVCLDCPTFVTSVHTATVGKSQKGITLAFQLVGHTGIMCHRICGIYRNYT